jgi:hypothetical protein
MTALLIQRAFSYAFIVSFLVLLVQCSSERVHLKHQLRSLKSPHIHHIHKRQNVSTVELTEAQKIVTEAVAQQNIYNENRVANPKRNTYLSRHSSEARSANRKRDNEPSPPALNETLLAAASHLAESHAAAQLANGTLHKKYPQPQNLKHHASNITKRAWGDAGYIDPRKWTLDAYLATWIFISHLDRSFAMSQTQYLQVEQKALVSSSADSGERA